MNENKSSLYSKTRKKRLLNGEILQTNQSQLLHVERAGKNNFMAHPKQYASEQTNQQQRFLLQRGNVDRNSTPQSSIQNREIPLRK